MKKKISDYIIKIFLVVIGLSFLFPLFWMVCLSFKDKSEVYNNPFGLPKIWDLSNYSEALQSYNFFQYFKNSAIYTVGTGIIVIVLGSMFAYCVTRMKWKYGNIALNYITLGLIIPVQVVVIPLYMMLKKLGIKDSYMGLITPYSAFALSSCVLMLHAFLRTLPKELEEAASIDGCNIYQTFYKIILPVIKPALATQFVLVFMNTWNEFFLAFIIAGKDKFRPLTVGLMNFFVSIGVADWGLIGAAMIITSLPTVIVYVLGTKQIENALTAGAILK